MRWKLSGNVWRVDWHFDAHGERVTDNPPVYVVRSFYHYYDYLDRACEILKEFSEDGMYFDLCLSSE